jgi:hypothetical protein
MVKHLEGKLQTKDALFLSLYHVGSAIKVSIRFSYSHISSFDWRNAAAKYSWNVL